MIIGQVINSVWCTRKEDSLTGMKLLIVKLLDSQNSDNSRNIVAVDLIGAGIGERVLITQGSSARKSLGSDEAPIDSIIIGIIDENAEL